jgi:hypothetical protein
VGEVSAESRSFNDPEMWQIPHALEGGQADAEEDPLGDRQRTRWAGPGGFFQECAPTLADIIGEKHVVFSLYYMLVSAVRLVTSSERKFRGGVQLVVNAI